MVFTLATARTNPYYWWLVAKARRARRSGEYRRQTLGYFLRVWQLSGDINDLLAYALFRRDLGYPLPKRWVKYLKGEIHRLQPKRQLLAVALLFEVEGTCPEPERLRALPESGQIQSPVILSCLSENGVGLGAVQSQFKHIHDQQQHWREAFKAGLFKQNHRGAICVVGNAGNMKGALLGDVIDQHDCVARFNTFSSSETDVKDMGYKHNIWVVTPGFEVAALPESFSGTVIMTGPDMRYRLLSWSGVAIVVEHDLKLLTTPLQVWRDLVRKLQAPPSAGIVFLAWLKVLLGSWKGVSVAGFNALSEAESVYHHTDTKHKPSARHNWAAEAILLQRWQREGLTSLHG